ncbi:hypothetical protein CY35_06G112000 [Sphagnum magellanicum]|nr:hypothetical protein CY35_06G112000 [Sphagnum magellanicum]
MKTEYGNLHAGIKIGNILGIKGFPGKSKTGELGIFSKSITVLSFCLHMLPKGQAATSKNQEKEEVMMGQCK